MAKKHNKLKSSLDRYKHEQNIKQQQKAMDKKKEKVKIPTRVDKLPFKEDDSILLIGEGEYNISFKLLIFFIKLIHNTFYIGNFSFTLSLLKDHNLSPFQLTSTSVEKEQVSYICIFNSQLDDLHVCRKLMTNTLIVKT